LVGTGDAATSLLSDSFFSSFFTIVAGFFSSTLACCFLGSSLTSGLGSGFSSTIAITG